MCLSLYVLVLQDYCSKDGFEAGCDEGQVINITIAFYGRPKGKAGLIALRCYLHVKLE